MTDNFEEVEHQETVHTEEPPQPPMGVRSNLVEAWRTRPIFKLLVVMTVAGAAIAAGTALFSNTRPEQMSRLVNPPEMHQAPGGPASPYFIQQTKEAEQQRSKQALEQGTSSLPTPIGQAGDITVASKADPMNELRGETEHLKQQLAQMQQVQQQPNAQQQRQQNEQFDTTLSQAMQTQMKQMMDSWAPKGIRQVEVTKLEAQGAAGTPGQNGAIGDGLPPGPPPKPIVPAGTISYAQLLTEANSDVPTPILAQIVSGPLNGARAVGSFQVANGYNDYLVLRFHLADLKGKDYTIDAIALDPDTTLGGMETEVDQRYFTRVILPAAAGFLQGFGQALSQTNTSTSQSASSTVVTQASPGVTQGLAQGASAAASTAAQFFQNQANLTKPLVRVAAGTPMGLFFVSSVMDPDAIQQQQQNGAANGGCPAGTAPGYAIGGHVINSPGVPPNGCYPGTGGAASPVGYPLGGANGGYNPFNPSPGLGTGYGGNANNAQSSDVPYPNYANQSSMNRGYGSTASPFGSPFSTPSNTGYYGH